MLFKINTFEWFEKIVDTTWKYLLNAPSITSSFFITTFEVPSSHKPAPSPALSILQKAPHCIGGWLLLLCPVSKCWISLSSLCMLPYDVILSCGSSITLTLMTHTFPSVNPDYSSALHTNAFDSTSPLGFLTGVSTYLWQRFNCAPLSVLASLNSSILIGWLCTSQYRKKLHVQVSCATWCVHMTVLWLMGWMWQWRVPFLSCAPDEGV